MNSQTSRPSARDRGFAPRVMTRTRREQTQIVESDRLLREFAHDRSATLLLRCDALVRRAAFGLLRFFGR